MPSIHSISSYLKLTLFKKKIKICTQKPLLLDQGGKNICWKLRPKLWKCHYSVESKVVDIQGGKSSVVFIFHLLLFRLFLLKIQAIPAGGTHKSIQRGQDTLLSFCCCCCCCFVLVSCVVCVFGMSAFEWEVSYTPGKYSASEIFSEPVLTNDLERFRVVIFSAGCSRCLGRILQSVRCKHESVAPQCPCAC